MPIYGPPPLRSDIGGLRPLTIPVSQAQIVTRLAAYSLTADAGSFALAGGTAAPLAGHRLVAAGTSYTLSGSATGLLDARRLTAVAGSFALVGASTGLIRRLVLPASAGSFALSGASTGLIRRSTLVASAGSFAVSAPAAAFFGNAGAFQPNAVQFGAFQATAVAAAYTIAASGGVYVLTGGVVGLPRRLSAVAGTFALTGGAASFLRSDALQASAGTFALTGAPLSFKRAYVLPASAGAFALAGVDATLTRGAAPVASAFQAGAFQADAFQLTAAARSLAADGGVFSLTGAPADLIVSRPITVLLGGGRAAVEPLRHYRLHASAGRFALAASDARLLVGRYLGAEPGVFDLLPGDADLTAQLFDWVGNDNDFLLLAA